MRKIEIEMLAAIRAGHNWQNGNTAVEVWRKQRRVYLHGNLIAIQWPQSLAITLACWNTATTRSRLNALLTSVPGHHRVTQRDFEPFFNGVSLTHKSVLIDRTIGDWMLFPDWKMETAGHE